MIPVTLMDRLGLKIVLYHIRSLRESDCYPSFSICLESEVEHISVFAVAVDTYKDVTGVAICTMSATFRNSLTPQIGGDARLYAINTISVISAGGPLPFQKLPNIKLHNKINTQQLYTCTCSLMDHEVQSFPGGAFPQAPSLGMLQHTLTLYM